MLALLRPGVRLWDQLTIRTRHRATEDQSISINNNKPLNSGLSCIIDIVSCRTSSCHHHRIQSCVGWAPYSRCRLAEPSSVSSVDCGPPCTPHPVVRFRTSHPTAAPFILEPIGLAQNSQAHHLRQTHPTAAPSLLFIISLSLPSLRSFNIVFDAVTRSLTSITFSFPHTTDECTESDATGYRSALEPEADHRHYHSSQNLATDLSAGMGIS